MHRSKGITSFLRVRDWERSREASAEPTTGSTSHLYPGLLAILYWAGAKDKALPTAGFFLNTFFYLLFLLLYLDVVRRMAPDSLFLASWLRTKGSPRVYFEHGSKSDKKSNKQRPRPYKLHRHEMIAP